MSLSIVHIASEMVPFSKTGGLADVAEALPIAQASLGNTVRVVVPCHRVDLRTVPPGDEAGTVEAMGMTATVRRRAHRGVEVLLVDAPALFARPAPYTVAGMDYPDNAMRFAFFARAALKLAAAHRPDVVHAHDWQASLAPLLLAHDPATRRTLPTASSVITIHNLAFQGVFPSWALAACDIPSRLFTMDILEYYGKVSFLKGAIVSADAVTTVSPRYAQEILTPEFGHGLEGVLAARTDGIRGIVNGIDEAGWNPRDDAALPVTYDERTVAAGKAAARDLLLATQGVAAERPLGVVVSRLTEQKGLDVLAAAMDQLLALGLDLVILGTGESHLEDAFRSAEKANPGRVRVILGFDESLAHLLYAAGDLFLMPSRFEPCGLGQLIAMRYGTLPLVHRTGGLADTVRPADGEDGTGFVFGPLVAGALVEAAAQAVAALRRPRERARLVRNAMRTDSSWRSSAEAYVSLYETLA